MVLSFLSFASLLGHLSGFFIRNSINFCNCSSHLALFSLVGFQTTPIDSSSLICLLVNNPLRLFFRCLASHEAKIYCLLPTADGFRLGSRLVLFFTFAISSYRSLQDLYSLTSSICFFTFFIPTPLWRLA